MKAGFLLPQKKGKPSQGKASTSRAAQEESTASASHDVHTRLAQEESTGSSSSALLQAAVIRAPQDASVALQKAGSSGLTIVDVDASRKRLGQQARCVFARPSDDGGWPPLWGQEHDKSCETFKAQELVECLLRSWIEIGLMKPQSDDELAFLIGWVTSRLQQRECLPRAAQDTAPVRGLTLQSFVASSIELQV